MRVGGVRRYLEEAATNVPRDKPKETTPAPEPGKSHKSKLGCQIANTPASRLTRRTQVPETSTATTSTAREPTPSAEPISAGPSQTSDSSSQRKSFVPASQPDEAPTRKANKEELMEVEAQDLPPSAQPTPTARRVRKADCHFTPRSELMVTRH